MISNNPTSDGLGFMQLALNTADVAGTLRLYSEAFGFANAGAQTAWGDLIKIQGLDASARTLLWWMVGRQEFVQLEIFHHTNPRQRSQPDDWRPCDLGWVRFGISVRNFDHALSTLRSWQVPLLAEPADDGRGRRAAFRDPFVGVIVELMEESARLPGGIRRRHFDLDPAIVYITSSVSDADSARHYYERQIGLEIGPLEELHSAADEKLWGLGGANRKGFVAKAGDAYLEVVQYTDPIGRPLPADYRLSDQGIMNVGLATENRGVLEAVISRLDAEGRGPPRIMSGPGFLGTYILDRERELELLSCPKSIGEFLGFVPGPNFLGVPSNSSGSMVLEERSPRR